MTDDTFDGLNQPLKALPAFGCFLYWPTEGDDWIAEEDRFVVRHLIPGGRIFMRHSDLVDGWNLYSYGRIAFRAAPVSWTPVEQPSFERGDHVEIKSDMNQRHPAVAVIREVIWNNHLRQIEFKLMIAGSRQPRPFTADELQLLAPLGENLPVTRNRNPLQYGGYLFKRPANEGGPEIELQ